MQKTLKHILKHPENVSEKTPLHCYAQNDDIMSTAIKLIDNSKMGEAALSEIFLKKDKDGNGISINKYNILLFLRTFKNNEKFMSEFMNTDSFKSDFTYGYDEVTQNIVHKELKEKSPEILYKLYKDTAYRYFLIHDEDKKQNALCENMAKNILDLVTDSDLSTKDSLSLLGLTESNLNKYSDPKLVDHIKMDLIKTVQREKKLNAIKS